MFTPFLTVFICSPAYFPSCVDYIFVSEDQSGIDRTLCQASVQYYMRSSLQGVGCLLPLFIFDLVI